MEKINILLVIFVFGLILISGCSHIIEETTITANENKEDVSEIKEFDIIAKQWEFIPNTITVNNGDKVKLHINSIDVTHGFKLPEFNIDERIEPGKTIDIEFIADKTGTFTFSCSVPCGSGHSTMKGQLIVK